MKPIFVIKDRAIDGYGDPFAQPSSQHAMRWFRDLVNQADTPFAKHPDDYDLYSIGIYNEQTAELVKLDVPLMQARGKDLVYPKE